MSFSIPKLVPLIAIETNAIMPVIRRNSLKIFSPVFRGSLVGVNRDQNHQVQELIEWRHEHLSEDIFLRSLKNLCLTKPCESTRVVIMIKIVTIVTIMI